MDDFSELDFLLAPDAEARAMAAARLRALRRGTPQDLALALSPEPGAHQTGAMMMGMRQRGEERLGSAAEARQRLAVERGALGVHQRQLTLQERIAKQYQLVPTPSGEALIFNPSTGQFSRPFARGAPAPTQPMPSHVPSGAPPTPAQPPLSAAPPPRPPFAKPLGGDVQRQVGGLGAAALAMQNALRVGFPENRGLGGLAQSLEYEAIRRGVPALARGRAQQAFSSWYNVASPIVHARTGQQMSVQELKRELVALIPLPGETDETQLMKVRNLVPMLRHQTVGLQQDIGDLLNADLDQAEAMVPRTVEELRSMRGQPPQGAQPPQDVSGRRIYQR